MEIKLPEGARYILKKLYSSGYKGYIVGGCVRDSLLGKVPADFDIASNAQPCDVMDMFKDFKLLSTGLKHGTVTVIIDNMPFEVTTFRKEGAYSDYRRPDHVEFIGTIDEDLSRRDFTINSMAYNPREGLVDLYGGYEDLCNGIIRCVGDADARFKEDALRMMRAIRFSAQLGFEIDKYTFDSIVANAALIKKISCERIKDELCKMLLSDNAGKLSLLFKAGLMDNIIPELSDHVKLYRSEGHLIKCIDESDKDLVVRLTIMFYEIASLAAGILKRLKFQNSIIDNVDKTLHFRGIKLKEDRVSIKRELKETGEECFIHLLAVREALVRADNEHEKLIKIDNIKEIVQDILNKNECFNRKMLCIGGNDIKKIGVNDGRTIGLMIDALINKVIENPELNKKDILIKYAEEIKKTDF